MTQVIWTDVVSKEQTLGQFETPANVADLLLAFCLRRPNDWILDPSCGTGALLKRAARFQRWFAPRRSSERTLWGVELDPEAAKMAQAALPEAHIFQGNFFELLPWEGKQYDSVVGNPPYTRAEWIGKLSEGWPGARQLSIFNGLPIESPQEPEPAKTTAYKVPKDILNRRAGLHAHFFVHATPFLREGGRFGFIVPNSWLDVNYGQQLKQFLAEHYKILALIESTVERWFDKAKVNTCIIILEKCDDASLRAINRVRFIQLKKKLVEFIPYELNSRERSSYLEILTTRLLPNTDVEGEDFKVRVVQQGELRPGDRWGVILRAPSVYRRRMKDSNLVGLNHWAKVSRGLTTGANDFFYLDRDTAREWQIEANYLKPLLKSLRHVERRTVKPENCLKLLLDIPAAADLSNSAAGEYVSWGESQGYCRRRTCANRIPWYSLPDQDRPEFVLPKGVWSRHFGCTIMGDLVVDQQLYGLRMKEGLPSEAAFALLNSAWFALQLELNGRVNFGEGVLWLAAYELGRTMMPDPRHLTNQIIDELTAIHLALVEEDVKPVTEQVHMPEWMALNNIVAKVLGLSPTEEREVIQGLLSRVSIRQGKAKSRYLKK